MLESDEKPESTTLIGSVDFPNKRQRLFKTLQALTDYIQVFNIENGAFGVMNDSKLTPIYVLEYQTKEQE